MNTYTRYFNHSDQLYCYAINVTCEDESLVEGLCVRLTKTVTGFFAWDGKFLRGTFDTQANPNSKIFVTFNIDNESLNVIANINNQINVITSEYHEALAKLQNQLNVHKNRIRTINFNG